MKRFHKRMYGVLYIRKPGAHNWRPLKRCRKGFTGSSYMVMYSNVLRVLRCRTYFYGFHVGVPFF